MTSSFMLFKRKSLDASKAISELYATEWLQPLMGGSQAALVRCNDGNLYILKLLQTPQGPNVLANEMLGSYLARSIDLPVAEISLISISQEFIEKYPYLWMSYPSRFISPQKGIHCGVHFIGDTSNINEQMPYISRSKVSFIKNRQHFLGMYVLDLWANHRDHRQALFLRDPMTTGLSAVFIDHGHMFGGPRWDFFDQRWIACHHEMSIYAGLWGREVVCAWIKKIQNTVPEILTDVISMIPEHWYSGDIRLLQTILMTRLAGLDQLCEVHHLREVSSHPRIS